MRVTRAAILFLFFIIPFLTVNYFETRRAVAMSFREQQYANMLEKAIDGATLMLYTETEPDSFGRITLNRELAVEGFFRVLNSTLGIEDVYEKDRIRSYIPLIMVIDYDGVWSYCPELSYDAGNAVVSHTFHEKTPFSETLGNQIITYTFQDHYELYDMATMRVYHGSYDDLKSLGISSIFDNTKATLEMRRQSIVTAVIEDELLRINDYNEFAEINGVHYSFRIPDTEGDLNINAIEGVGILAVVQGLPMGNSRFNLFSYSATSLEETWKVYGVNDGGLLVYHEAWCSHINGTVQEVFDSPQAAAAAGYWPHDCQ